MFKRIWKWLRDRVFRLPMANNSGGDVIRNNKALVGRTVKAVVAEVWRLKAKGEISANEFAKKLIARVLEPLPDGVELLASVLVEPKVRTWCHAVFTLRFTEAQAVEYLMGKLVGLP